MTDLAGRRTLPPWLVASARALRRGARAFRSTFWTRPRLALGTTPLSTFWAWDRGLPIHRLYVERFLSSHAADIRGCCLEFQEDSYTSRLGGSAVTRVDIIHVDDSNPAATIVADLTKPNTVPTGAFDCIICTHVLQHIATPDRAVSELARILRPGGVLLVAEAHISMCDRAYGELWRFTPLGMRRLLSGAFGDENVGVQGYGNSLIAAAEIRGLASHEVFRHELRINDERFAVEVCGRAVKHQ